MIPKRNLQEKLINLFTGFLGHLPPFAFAVGLDVGGQGIVFLGRPRPSLHPFLGAARPPAHLSLSLSLSLGVQLASSRVSRSTFVDRAPPAYLNARCRRAWPRPPTGRFASLLRTAATWPS